MEAGRAVGAANEAVARGPTVAGSARGTIYEQVAIIEADDCGGGFAAEVAGFAGAGAEFYVEAGLLARDGVRRADRPCDLARSGGASTDLASGRT